MVATYAVDVHSQEHPRQLGRYHRQHLGPVVMTAGAVVAILASFLRWIRSGEVSRSSYEILGLVHRLGFAPDGPIRIVVRAWPLMPLTITAAVVAAWWGWRLVAVVLGVIGGLYAAGLGGVVAFAVPTSREVGVSSAPAATAVGAAVVVVGSLLCLFLRVPSEDANTR
jgi:hypothetical protein